MCFTVLKIEGYFEAKVAEEDIVCYKYLEEGLKAPYREDFTYEVGKVYPKVKLVVRSGTIYEGYHSYTETAFKEEKLFYHPFYKCIIPAGSRYYENPERGEYVSDSIVVTTDQPLSWEETTVLIGLDKKVNQEEFNTFFTELIAKGVQRKDFSDTHYRLYGENGDWLFEVNQNPNSFRFWYSMGRVYPLFEEKFGVSAGQLSWLMQPVLESHFNMKGVTPNPISETIVIELESHFNMKGVTPYNKFSDWVRYWNHTSI